METFAVWPKGELFFLRLFGPVWDGMGVGEEQEGKKGKGKSLHKNGGS